MPSETSDSHQPAPPPRAFTQGAGLVFQFAGVTLFLVAMFICCGSSLLSKDVATKSDLTHIGWHLQGDRAESPSYSAQKALTISLFVAVFLGLAFAATGLGMQAERREAPPLAVVLSLIGAVFWSIQVAFAAQMHSFIFTAAAAVLLACCVILLILSIPALREIRRNPPPPGHEILPADYKIPYSHYHPDPPEVRLAKELEQRRQRLEVEQKELEALQEKLNRKLDEEDPGR